jgi:hypothetical protein
MIYFCINGRLNVVRHNIKILLHAIFHTQNNVRGNVSYLMSLNATFHIRHHNSSLVTATK